MRTRGMALLAVASLWMFACECGKPTPTPTPTPQPEPTPDSPYELGAPPLDRSVGTDLCTATQFLYTGTTAIQTGVAPGTIDCGRVAVLRGRVQTREGQPLAGVAISALNHPEFGQTLTRDDGRFDLAVNGGGLLTVNYAKAGYLPIQRKIELPWRDYLSVEDVVLSAPDPQVTLVAFSAGAPLQVVRGSPVNDRDGTRQATLLVPPSTQATLVLPDGTTQTPASLNVRATEYTVGEMGPGAMPAELPPTSGYTYSVEFSVDEAVAAGATEVRFDKPLINYTENFINAPVGSAVPTGSYDRKQGKWLPSKNGRVVKILGMTNGMADLDVTGSGQPANASALAALGVSEAERASLATLYTAGQSLLRVEIQHFSPWDHNWPYGPPPGAQPPQLGLLDKEPPNPCQTGGTIIKCETQTLGETVSIVGTPFNLVYQSDRVPGWTAAKTVDIPIIGPVMPPLKGVRLLIDIAGRRFEQRWAMPNPSSPNPTLPPPTPNLTYHFAWDGLDAYGRPVQGRPLAVIRVMYIYPLEYYEADDRFQESFAQFGQNLDLFDGRGACRSASLADGYFFCGIPIQQTLARAIGPWDVSAIDGLGGWTLDVHHGYDPNEKVLHKGDGTKIRAEALMPVARRIAGGQTEFPAAEGGSALEARLDYLSDIAVGPDGSIYEASGLNYNHIRRIDPNGVIRTVAGTGTKGDPTGDGGPALSAVLGDYVNGIAVGPDGSIYFTTIGANSHGYVRKIDPNGIITTIAGRRDWSTGDMGDGGLAVNAQVSAPTDVIVGPDGSVYFGELKTRVNGWKARVRKIDPNGIITMFVGGGADATRDEDMGAGEPALQHELSEPTGLAFGPDGTLYIAHSTDSIVVKVAPNGILTRIAGTRNGGHSGDGGQAILASIGGPTNVTVGRDGAVYIRAVDGFPSSTLIRKIDTHGIITTVAGRKTGREADCDATDNPPVLQTCISSHSRGLEIQPDGSILYSDGRHWIRRIASPLPGFGTDSSFIPSEDGTELYELSGNGRHLHTLDAVTGAVRHTFAYDTAGRLSTATDGDGNVTRIERDADGKALAIVSPDGQRTGLTLDANAYLASVTSPAGETARMTYGSGGLLATFTDPRGGTARFEYDAVGRLVRDTDAAGGVQSLLRSETIDSLSVTVRSDLGRETTFASQVLSTGDRLRTVRKPGGAPSTSLVGTDGTQTLTDSTGVSRALTLAPDPRWGMRAPVTKSLFEATPSGLRREITAKRTLDLADPTNPLSLRSLTDQFTVNGRTYTSAYSSATRTLTTLTPSRRQAKMVLDGQGRAVQAQVGTLSSTSYAYDSRGRLSSITQGSGADARTGTLSYNSAGYLDTITDPLGRTTSFGYDVAGRLTAQTLPGGRVIRYTYDPSSNLTSITPPGRPAHSFSYTPVNLPAAYTPPTVGAAAHQTLYAYNTVRQLLRFTRPDGQTVDLGYDSADRLSTLSLPTGQHGYTYDPTTGNLVTNTAPGGTTLTYTYDGSLLTRAAWSGAVSGTVNRTYDNSLRVSSQSVNGGNTVDFQYDNDSLLVHAGSVSLSRDPQTGLITGTTLGNMTDTRTYNSFSELVGYSAASGGTSLFAVDYARDKLGRITQKVETIGGSTKTYSYTYDPAGRLTEVKVNSATGAAYTYDSNSNRLSYTGPSGTVTGSYDDQDRLTRYGATTFGYTANGELLIKSTSGQTTTYQYDALGNLLTVRLANGTSIEYLIDGQYRRIGRKVNGALVQGFLYQDDLRPIAELDASGNVASLFVYASRANVPDYMIKSGTTYRIVADHLGSPRLVVNTTTGQIVQQLDFDEFGSMLSDTNPGFQPFGFAGGLYDRDTGFVRFGARNYDAETGRWTRKDPIGFMSRDVNLYAYVANDPVNNVDPSGYLGFGGSIGVGAEMGLGHGAAAQASVGNAAFWGGESGLNMGSYYSHGGFLGGDQGGWQSVTSEVGSVVGAGAGVGWQLFVTNATSVNDLAGPFTSLQAGIGIFGIQLASDGRIYQFSFGISKSWGESFSIYKTTTVPIDSTAPCP